MRSIAVNGPLAASIGFLLLGAIVSGAAAGEASRGAKAITCTNPASGAKWQIKVDFDRRTVDSHPAEIGESEISWRTDDGENYKLDRKSGHLRVVVASSTGGYFLHDQCNPDN